MVEKRSLGDRMKENYEKRQSFSLLRRLPVIIRVDGRAFHTFTSLMTKPFSSSFMLNMLEAAKKTSEQIQGFKMGYVQSDEVSFLLTDYDKLTTDAWFGYDKSKLESITAALMSVHFHQFYPLAFPVFDARSFNLPVEEISNYFLWRAKDWARNSLQMYCQSLFSHKELENKDKTAQHELLHERGKNWTTDLTNWERNGAFFNQYDVARTDILPCFTEIEEFVSSSLLSIPLASQD